MNDPRISVADPQRQQLTLTPETEEALHRILLALLKIADDPIVDEKAS